MNAQSILVELSRHERDYGLDLCAPCHDEREEAEINRVASPDGWKPLPPAHSIIAACRRYGVALRIDASTGDLMVGKAGAKAEKPTQPWPSLPIAIQAYLDVVASLVEGDGA